jgi:Cu+-exporting ATPase
MPKDSHSSSVAPINPETILQVDGMTCSNCASGIQKMLIKNGLPDAQVSFAAGEVLFSAIENYPLEKVKADIHRLGYQVIEPKIDPEVSAFSALNIRLIVASLFTLPLLAHMFSSWQPLHNPLVQLILCTPVMIVGFLSFGRSAWASVKTGSPNMDVLVTTGSFAAFIYSCIGIWLIKAGENPHNYLFFETAASIITFVLAGNALEKRTLKQTGNSLQQLAHLQPETALRVHTHGDQEHVELIPSKLVVPGDVLQVNSGGRISADGIITSGFGFINEAMVTGESLPVEKTSGDPVTGGTLLEQGSIRFKALKTGNQTVLAGIINLVKKAQVDKPPVQRVGDQVSAVFVPVVMAIAALTFLISWMYVEIPIQEAFMRAIAVLVISCPCAMGLATPTAIMAGIGRAAKNGILFRSGTAMENLARVKIIVLDKTGTITNGSFKIKEIQSTGKFSMEEIYSMIVALERKSSHPIAQSIVRELELKSKPVEFSNVLENKGLGMEATLPDGRILKFGSKRLVEGLDVPESDLYLTLNDEYIACLSLMDELKPGAMELISGLKKLGIEPILLSGDSDRKCQEIAALLSIGKVYSEQLPGQKLEIIRELARTQPVAMVGDGINDAPALNLASVGISMSAATQIAVSSAQVILNEKSDLTGILEAVKLSRLTLRTIHQNLFWAFFYNTIAIPVAALGLLSPMIAAFSMAFSDIVVIGNSIRLQIRRIH